MKSLLLIFLGGGTGSVLRYLLTISIYRQKKYPSGSIPHRTGGIEIAPQLLNLILISRHFVRL